MLILYIRMYCMYLQVQKSLIYVKNRFVDSADSVYPLGYFTRDLRIHSSRLDPTAGAVLAANVHA